MSTGDHGTDDLPNDDEVRPESGVGGEIVADANSSDPAATADSRPTQDEPSMDASPTTVQAKIDGIVAQTRADFPGGADPAGFEHALRRRFTDTGIDVSDDQIKALAAG
jgi:hypothetical protein